MYLGRYELWCGSRHKVVSGLWAAMVALTSFRLRLEEPFQGIMRLSAQGSDSFLGYRYCKTNYLAFFVYPQPYTLGFLGGIKNDIDVMSNNVAGARLS